MRLVCCLVLVLGGLQLACALRVAAWNIETFGRSKANLINSSPRKAAILEYIAMVIRHYDIIVIQEVKDTSANCDVCAEVLRVVNLNQPAHLVYAERHSDSMGRNHERYLYLYRMATVQVHQLHQFINPVANPPTFDRPPYVARFQNLGGQPFDYTFIPLHASPTGNPPPAGRRSAAQEIDSLADVRTHINGLWNTNNILLLGDFNAGCTYVRPNDFQNIRLWILPAYHVLINHNVLTNVPPVQTLCPYDRIVATIPMNNQHVVPGTAQRLVFNLQWPIQQVPNAPPITPQQISNHYPVEVMLNP